MDFRPDYNDCAASNGDKSSPSMAFASIAFGIISVITSCFGTSLIFGSLGMILALLSRGGSNNYPKNTVIGLALNIFGIVFGILLIVITVICVVSFGGVDNFMNAMQNYMNAYYSAYGIAQP